MTELSDFAPFDCFSTIQQTCPPKASKLVVINVQSSNFLHPLHLAKIVHIALDNKPIAARCNAVFALQSIG